MSLYFAQKLLKLIQFLRFLLSNVKTFRALRMSTFLRGFFLQIHNFWSSENFLIFFLKIFEINLKLSEINLETSEFFWQTFAPLLFLSTMGLMCRCTLQSLHLKVVFLLVLVQRGPVRRAAEHRHHVHSEEGEAVHKTL